MALKIHIQSQHFRESVLGKNKSLKVLTSSFRKKKKKLLSTFKREPRCSQAQRSTLLRDTGYSCSYSPALWAQLCCARTGRCHHWKVPLTAPEMRVLRPLPEGLLFLLSPKSMMLTTVHAKSWLTNRKHRTSQQERRASLWTVNWLR